VESHNAYQSFLREMCYKHYSVLRNAVTQLAIADCIISFAHVALRKNYVRPQFTDSDMLEIIDGRHPMIEELRSDPFIPNSIKMGDGSPGSKIITGPNMGGFVQFIPPSFYSSCIAQKEFSCQDGCIDCNYGANRKLCTSDFR